MASRASRTAPDARELPRLSTMHGGSSVWSVRPGRRNCNPSFRGLRTFRGSCDLAAHAAHVLDLALEIHVVRQLEMLDEPGRLDVVGMIQHELDVLRRRGHFLAKV